MPTTPKSFTVSKRIAECPNHAPFEPGDEIVYEIELCNPGPVVDVEIDDSIVADIESAAWVHTQDGAVAAEGDGLPSGSLTVPTGASVVTVTVVLADLGCPYTVTNCVEVTVPDQKDPIRAIAETIIVGGFEGDVKVCPPYANDNGLIFDLLVGSDEAKIAKLMDAINLGVCLTDLLLDDTVLTEEQITLICDIVISKFDSEILKDIITGCIEQLITKEGLASLLQTGDLTP